MNIEPKLDVYLPEDNVDNEVISGPEDMCTDDECEDSIRRILHENRLSVNNSVTVERVKEMLYLDTNSHSCLQV